MKKLIVLIILMLTSVSEANNRKVELEYDWEDLNKTIVGIEQIFSDKDTKNIKKLGSTLFISSKAYQQLINLVLKTDVSFMYSTEHAKKSFQILNKTNKKRKLNVDFIRKKDRYWYISNAVIINGDGSKIEFKEKGFRPLSFEYNFSDFINEIRHKRISNYSGLAPNGKLPLSFFSKNKLSPVEESNLLIKNVLLRYKNGDIAGFYFMEFEYIPFIDNKKRGWLLAGFGSMNDYVLEHSSNMYEKFLISGFQVVKDDIRNNKYKSPYSFFITVIEDVKKALSKD